VRLVNAIAALVIVGSAIVAVVVLRSPGPPAPVHHGLTGSDAAELRYIVAEVAAYKPGSADAAPTPPHPAPIDPFAAAHAGDWRASRLTNDSELGPIHAKAMHVVTTVGDDKIAIHTYGLVDGEAATRNSATTEAPRHGATFEQLVATDWPIPDFAAADDTYTASGRAFHCKKVTYREIDRVLPRKLITREMWLSPDVPVDGVVATHEVQTIDHVTFTMTEELVGFGTGSATAWGTRPTGL
jgi:hypothetical protein